MEITGEFLRFLHTLNLPSVCVGSYSICSSISLFILFIYVKAFFFTPMKNTTENTKNKIEIHLKYYYVKTINLIYVLLFI